MALVCLTVHRAVGGVVVDVVGIADHGYAQGKLAPVIDSASLVVSLVAGSAGLPQMLEIAVTSPEGAVLDRIEKLLEPCPPGSARDVVVDLAGAVIGPVGQYWFVVSAGGRELTRVPWEIRALHLDPRE